MDDFVTHLPISLRPDPARVVIKPFVPAEAAPGYVTSDNLRAQRIVDQILALEPAALAQELQRVCSGLSARYRASEEILLRRFDEVNGVSFAKCTISRDQAMLVGAFFSEEYAFRSGRVVQSQHRAASRPIRYLGWRGALCPVAARRGRRASFFDHVPQRNNRCRQCNNPGPALPASERPPDRPDPITDQR